LGGTAWNLRISVTVYDLFEGIVRSVLLCREIFFLLPTELTR